jgi:hypothetical protein
MMSEFNDYAFELSWEVSHFREFGLDWDKDIEIEKYDDYEEFSVTDVDLFEHPNPIIFQGCKPIVRHIDYPYPDNDWNVMSRRMYEVLLSVGDFPHRIIPIVMVNSLTFVWDWFEGTVITRENAYQEGQPSIYAAGNKSIKKEVCFGDFVLVHITEHLDFLDRENCVFNRSITKEELRELDEEFETAIEDRESELEMENNNIDEYAFTIPENGLPPIFKIPESSISTFVSAEAREAMRKAKITGVQFISLKGNSGGELRAWLAGDEYEGEDIRTWTDTKIVLPDDVDEELEKEIELWQGTPND